MKKLQHLSLLENPVTKHKGYRLYVISRCPGLKWLDFVKVKAAERDEVRPEILSATKGWVDVCAQQYIK